MEPLQPVPSPNVEDAFRMLAECDVQERYVDTLATIDHTTRANLRADIHARRQSLRARIGASIAAYTPTEVPHADLIQTEDGRAFIINKASGVPSYDPVTVIHSLEIPLIDHPG